MAESLRGGLSLGLSGFGFWSHDIGGFENTSPADLYKRWVAFGLLSSHSRLHGSSSYRVPWLYDEESVDVVRHFTNLKYRLMPYLYDQADQGAAQGLPMMRAMVLEFADDPTCSYLDRQYMLGESLLVAPILNEDGEATFYLPAGSWTHFLTGERVVGGGWRQERHDYFSLPLYVRPGSLIAVGAVESRPDYDYASGVTFHLYELAEGAAAWSRVVTGPDGVEGFSLHVARTLDGYIVRWEGEAEGWSLLLRGVDAAAGVQGGHAKKTKDGVRVVPEPGSAGIVVTV